MDPSTATGAYGFGSYTPAVPGGVSIQPETQLGAIGEIPGAVLTKTGLGHQNPLFWILVFALVFTGYLYGGFDIGIKRIGRETLKVG